MSTVIVSKRFLLPGDRLLLIDGLPANGAALEGLTGQAGPGCGGGGGH